MRSISRNHPANPFPTRRRPVGQGKARSPSDIARALPLVRAIVGTIRATAKELEDTVRQAEDCSDRLDQMGPLLDKESYLLDLADEVQRLQSDLVAQAHEIEELGGFLVDPTSGGVDFDSQLGGQPVNLCWLPEEAAICQFHSTDETCGSRRALPQ